MTSFGRSFRSFSFTVVEDSRALVLTLSIELPMLSRLRKRFDSSGCQIVGRTTGRRYMSSLQPALCHMQELEWPLMISSL